MSLQRGAVIYLIALGYLQIGSSCVQLFNGRMEQEASAAAQQKDPDVSAAARLIVEKTNVFRAEQSRHPVEVDAKLAATAQYFADDLARTEKLAHDADGNRPADRARQHGYVMCLIDENIADEYNSEGFTTAELADKFVAGWKQSPGHRKNMLDPDVTDTGVAVAQSKSGTYYAVQMFGRPRSQSIRFQIVNRTDSTITYALDQNTFTLPAQTTRRHEQCRPAELVFHEGTGEPITLRPKNGETLAVFQDPAGGFGIKRE
jgi:uncharacterized protein YkwD